MSKFECNIEETFNQFQQLASQDMTRAVKRALAKGAKALQDQAKSNLSSVIKTRGNTHWYDGKIKNFDDKIDDGVRRTKVYENLDEDWETKVHVLGTRASGSGTYRLRFLEAGTKERFAKTARNRKHELIRLKTPKRLGRITGRRFFRAAQQQILPQIQSIYLKEINDSIQRVNNS